MQSLLHVQVVLTRGGVNEHLCLIDDDLYRSDWFALRWRNEHKQIINGECVSDRCVSIVQMRHNAEYSH